MNRSHLKQGKNSQEPSQSTTNLGTSNQSSTARNRRPRSRSTCDLCCRCLRRRRPAARLSSSSSCRLLRRRVVQARTGRVRDRIRAIQGRRTNLGRGPGVEKAGDGPDLSDCSVCGCPGDGFEKRFGRL